MKNEQRKEFIIQETASIVEAMQKIDLNAKGILFVVDEKEKLVGVITDGDIRRWLIKTGQLQATIKNVMNKEPKAIYRKEINVAKEFMEKYAITALPIITTKHMISDIIFKEEKIGGSEKDDNVLEQVPVVVMAGGKGTRLYPYTKILPKPLIPIGDVPIMERIINNFRDYGVKDFYATVNYKKGMIKS